MSKEKESVRVIMNRLVRRLAKLDGYEYLSGFDMTDQNVTPSSHPMTCYYLMMAEAAYEEITGDRPDYSDCETDDAKGWGFRIR